MKIGDNKAVTLPSQPRHSPVIAPKKEYCYQCRQSLYDIYPNKGGNSKLCLWCDYLQKHIPKDRKIGDCEGFGNIEVPEWLQKIQRERLGE